MLLGKPTLDLIFAGEVDLVFRRWTRPTVKAGGTLRTSGGLLDILDVDRIAIDEITDDEAGRAGLGRDELVGFLESRQGEIYRVRVRPGGPDPRVELRESSDLSVEDIEAIDAALDRLDRASKTGPWTREYLRLLLERPHVRAQDLADSLGLDKAFFKDNVRKLKNLGLTISFSPGYEVSPRGKAYLKATGGDSE